MIIIKEYKGTKILYSSDKETFKEALEEAVRKNISLVGADLSHQDLTNADLRAAYLRRCYFNGSNLTGANFRSEDLSCCKFRECDLTNVYFKDTIFYNTDFTESNIDAIDKKTMCFGRLKLLASGTIY